ncbi:MAG: mechanosensitive ion channel family protein [Lachnospiraceae bacterium]|nr:mechanosensitive ion channel family protein [Lachnospiraceae bacterium]
MWEEFIKQAPQAAFNLGVRIVIIAVIFFIGTRVIKIIMRLINKSLNKAGAEKGVITFIDSFLNIVMYAFLIMVLASGFGVDAASILAIFGSATLAIGLALQGSLSNLAGGVVILLMKPFKVGDYIREDSHGNEGRVTEIQIFYTRLTTVDNKEVMIPNGSLANTSIVNVTWLPTRRIDFSIGISYEADLLKAKDIIKREASEIPGILDRDELRVFVRSLDESQATLGCRFYVENDAYWDSLWMLNENVKLAFDREGIEIPYNKLDVNVINKSLPPLGSLLASGKRSATTESGDETGVSEADG